MVILGGLGICYEQGTSAGVWRARIWPSNLSRYASDGSPYGRGGRWRREVAESFSSALRPVCFGPAFSAPALVLRKLRFRCRVLRNTIKESCGLCVWVQASRSRARVLWLGLSRYASDGSPYGRGGRWRRELAESFSSALRPAPVQKIMVCLGSLGSAIERFGTQ